MTWLSVDTVATLISYSPRDTRRKVDSGQFGKKGSGYRYQKGAKGRGGKQLQIALEASRASTSRLSETARRNYSVSQRGHLYPSPASRSRTPKARCTSLRRIQGKPPNSW